MFSLKKLVKILHKNGVNKALLFGSALYEKNPRDIDIAIDDYPKEKFFDILGVALMSSDKPIDLIDLNILKKHNKIFYKLLLQNSKKLI